MSLKCGIVGLPNVGKSTLFNAITRTQSAESANYPFCTIEPNIGNIAIYDERLKKMAEIVDSQKIIYNQLNLVDIAGLVKGASSGEGLGNKFLANIREVDAIMHVVRCFEDKNISHVESRIDPINDIELIETELFMADIQSLEKRISKKKGEDVDLAKSALENLNSGTSLNGFEEFDRFGLLSSKPVMYVCNVDEESAVDGNSLSDCVKDFASKKSRPVVSISASLEAEISSLGEDEDREAFLKDIGLKESGLNSIVKCGYSLLNLITFFTVGYKEARAWSVMNGSCAPKAAGVIHSDFERGFIKASTISYDDYILYGGESGCKSAGKLRLEGKDYVVQDGDVFDFKFNV